MSIPTNRNRLLKIWENYLNHQRIHLEQTTLDDVYGRVTRRLQKMPYWIESSQDFVEWMSTQENQRGEQLWGHETQRRTLQRLKAATAWANQTGQIARDPFEKTPNYKSRVSQIDQYRAFSVEERAAILSAATFLPTDKRQWVSALFYTGCRPSELRALKRKHWSRDGRQLQIVSAFPMGADSAKPTKTRRTTPDYPCNPQLQALLKEATAEAGNNDWIFRNPKGGPFNYHNFQRRTFRPLCDQLAKKGKIAFPLTQYHARHTWITEALKSLSIQDVSYLARTSPEIIMKHYAEKSRTLTVPEV